MSKPDPKQFFPNGKLHDDVAKTLGIDERSLSVAICRGDYPFKKCRLKVGKFYVYNWDACIRSMMKHQGYAA